MIILGIADHVNSGAAVIIDGVVVAAVNEERLVRKKMVFGVPRKAIPTVLSLAGVKPGEVDYVAIATINGHLINDYLEFNGWFKLDRGAIKQLFFSTGSRLSRLRRYFPWLEDLYYQLRNPVFIHRRAVLRNILREEFEIRCPVHFVNHHFGHACSAYFSSGYDEALVVSMDGGGDGLSSQVYDASGGILEKVHEVSSFNSLGNYYAYVTHLCGFQAGKHEGKVTGLAAYGEPLYADILRQLIDCEDGTIVNKGSLFYESALKGISSLLPKGWARKDLAASIQAHSEEVVRRYVGYWRKQTNKRFVALAGGLFANVKINQRVLQLEGVDGVLVHPGMTDEGLAVGAALAMNYELAKDRRSLPRQCMEHVYLGPSYSDDGIERALKEAGISYKRSEKIEDDIADLLSQGHVVARFSGAMEYGPRALGNRSILYQPFDPSVNDWLNKSLKRTEFMPFAPSTIAEEAAKCFDGVSGAEDTARFMTMTFNCTPWMKRECGGVVHVDGTARPQLVSLNDNPSYFKIIQAYRRKTGLPCIVNTSFNIHEEPIVCSPQDAIRAFQIGHLDVLAIGSFLVIDEQSIKRRALRQGSLTLAVTQGDPSHLK